MAVKTAPFMETLISEEAIRQRVAHYGDLLDREYEGRSLVVVMIMKGAFCFVADLIRATQVPCVVEPIRCSSYGHRGTERGELEITGIDAFTVKGEDVLVVDDICDTGNTLHAVVEAMKKRGANSVRSMVLLHRICTEPALFEPDYSLFEVERDKFVVGYGLDYKEQYRGLSSIHVIYP